MSQERRFSLTPVLLVANFANTKWCKKLENDWILAHGYSSESTQRELFQWIPTLQGLDDFQNSLHLVLCMKVASALEGLIKNYPPPPPLIPLCFYFDYITPPPSDFTELERIASLLWCWQNRTFLETNHLYRNPKIVSRDEIDGWKTLQHSIHRLLG